MDLKTDSTSRSRARTSPHRLLIALMALAIGVSGAFAHTVAFADDAALRGGELTLVQHVIASGSSSRSADGCLKLDATSGQPVAGFAQGGGFSLQIGYWPAAAAREEPIFRNGFETTECSQ